MCNNILRFITLFTFSTNLVGNLVYTRILRLMNSIWYYELPQQKSIINYNSNYYSKCTIDKFVYFGRDTTENAIMVVAMVSISNAVILKI